MSIGYAKHSPSPQVINHQLSSTYVIITSERAHLLLMQWLILDGWANELKTDINFCFASSRG